MCPCVATTWAAINPVFIAGNVNLSFSANDFLNASSGVVRFNNTFTSTIKSDGTNNLIAGSWITVAAGTPVINLYGFDIGVDPIALTGLATTNGQYILSTQAATEGGQRSRLLLVGLRLALAQAA